MNMHRWHRLGALAAVAAGMIMFAGCAAHEPGPAAEAVSWPRFGPPRDGLQLQGHTNQAPDFVGPIDGSARLTVFTEGNHFPVLLPLVFEKFPDWRRAHCDCNLEAEQILVITLPQVMMVEAMTRGSITLGNAVVHLDPEHVYPQIIMGGPRPLRRLAEAGIVLPRTRVFARHLGMGLLLRRQWAGRIGSLEQLAASEASIILATPNEAGARRQYRQTLLALLGDVDTRRLLQRETPTFPGRLGIQHRDVPYALLQGHADAGLIFGHLARFYAEQFPDRLAYVQIPKAAPLGQTITLTRTAAHADDALAACFERFLFEHAPTAYPAGGFAETHTFDFDHEIDLTADDPPPR